MKIENQLLDFINDELLNGMHAIDATDNLLADGTVHPSILLNLPMLVSPTEERVAEDFVELRKRLRSRSAAPPPGEVIAGENDTLGRIAARPEIYGDQRFWTVLFAANLDRITEHGELRPGTVLRVPR